jgi:hypothetical protein
MNRVELFWADRPNGWSQKTVVASHHAETADWRPRCRAAVCLGGGAGR